MFFKSRPDLADADVQVHGSPIYYADHGDTIRPGTMRVSFLPL